jgi:hypothetical protein
LDDVPAVKKAFMESRRVVVETIIDSSQMLQYFGAQISEESNEPYFTKTFRDSLDRELQEAAGISYTWTHYLKPMAMTAMLLQHYMTLAADDLLNKYTGEPIDMYFASQGKRDGKICTGLEDPLFQIKMLYNTQSIQEQAEELHDMVLHKEEYIKEGRLLLENYLSGNLDALYALGEKTALMSDMMEGLLNDRNEAWMKLLPELMKDGNTFIAVGALHLCGEEGLLSALKKMGYTLTAIPLR